MNTQVTKYYGFVGTYYKDMAWKVSFFLTKEERNSAKAEWINSFSDRGRYIESYIQTRNIEIELNPDQLILVAYATPFVGWSIKDAFTIQAVSKENMYMSLHQLFHEREGAILTQSDNPFFEYGQNPNYSLSSLSSPKQEDRVHWYIKSSQFYTKKEPTGTFYNKKNKKTYISTLKRPYANQAPKTHTNYKKVS